VQLPENKKHNEVLLSRLQRARNIQQENAFVYQALLQNEKKARRRTSKNQNKRIKKG
jgi:hypothetical protein